jgi:chromosome segregation ATPase
MSLQTESQILDAMAACRKRIATAESDLKKAQQQYDDLDEFSSRFAGRCQSIVGDLSSRQQRLSNADVNGGQVRSFASLKDTLQGGLNQLQQYTDKFSSQQASIRTALDNTENQIAQHKSAISSGNDELARLTQQLKAARAAAAAGV